MALENMIVLDATLTPEEFVDSITKEFGLTKAFNGKQWVALAEGISVSALSASALSKELAREKYDINAEIVLVCRIDKFEFHHVGMENQIRLLVGLLKRPNFDMAFLEGCDVPLLIRKDKTVYVDLQDNYWRTKLLPKLTELKIAVVDKSLRAS